MYVGEDLRIHSSNTEKTEEDKIRVAMFKFRRESEHKTTQERDAHDQPPLFVHKSEEKRLLMYFFGSIPQVIFLMNVMCGGPTHWHRSQYGIHT